MDKSADGGYPVEIDKLLKTTVEKKGSDLHLAVGIPPMVRVRGELLPLDYPILKPAIIDEMLMSLIDPVHRQAFEQQWELDISYAIPGVARFRGNIMRQRGSLAAVFRAVPFEVPKLEDLGLPEKVRDLCYLSRGLVLVTGPTGSGKSTTLAAMIDMINRERNLNIVTVEDPIEFLHRHKRSVVK